jgi:SAM-dependent methyltransferase
MAAAAPADVPPDWVSAVFQVPLEPLADAEGRPTGVWGLKDTTSAARISRQFTLDAGAYHARYSASAHFQALFSQAIAATGLTVAEPPLVLDLGSGSGMNSVLPCLNLFPGARVVATDLSPQLLARLAAHAAAAGLAERVACVVMDAMALRVRNKRFDLVLGASILHHLERPVEALEGAANALKPGASAIFTEPFDGYGLVRLAYERILAEAELRHDPLPEKVAAFMRDMIADIAARTLPDPKAPGFAELDDKWLFSRERLEKAAHNNGFGTVRFVPHNDHETLYRDQTYTQLRLSTGEDQPLPAWADAILDGFDRALRPPVKRLLMLEGTVVMTRAA